MKPTTAHDQTTQVSAQLTTQRWLSTIEKLGNRLPHPTALFIHFCLAIVIISAMAALFGLKAVSPSTSEIIYAKSLLSQEGLHYFLTNAVKNFVQFAPVGTLLVAILGLGIAEHSGLLPTLIKSLVKKTPASLLTTTVVFCGVMSSLASDSGYVVLLPLAAILFMQAGKHPIAGIACAFAGVSAGYSANLFVGPLDAILAGLSQEAAKVVSPTASVAVTSNYYFIVVSTLLITAVASFICHRYTHRQTQSLAYINSDEDADDDNHPNPLKASRALKATGLVFAILCALMLWGTLPSDGFLRAADGSFIQSPFLSGIVVSVALTAAICGITYGRVSGRYRHWHDCISGMEQHIAVLASYLVLMFFAAQFVNFFSWSQLGLIVAINGAKALQSLSLPLPVLLITFVLFTGFINLFIGSASAKWALLAPVFVPMFMLIGIAPEATQMAYRIGDSTTNIITPLMPYFGVVIAFMHKYNKNIGAGTVIALMLPYSLALLFSWTALLAIWLFFNLPLGPNAYAFLP